MPARRRLGEGGSIFVSRTLSELRAGATLFSASMRPFVAHALERLEDRFERLRKLHQPHIGKFCANRQMILTRESFRS